MGMLRFLLALSVVIQHSTPLFGHQLTTGIVAVQGFFVVSGFYMALILAEKYPATKQGTWLFYSNRFLRIYPVYWSVCGLFVVIWLLSKLFPGVVRPPGNALDLWIQWFPAFRWETIAYVVASNVALLGLDVGLFLKITDGALAFTSTLYQPEPRIYSLAFIPQAWTLGIEVIVYALAPFVFRLPTPALIVLAAASLALRGVFAANGVFAPPWDYRFLPFEFGLFVIGALAYRAYRSIDIRILASGGIPAFGCMLLLTFFFTQLPASRSLVPGFADAQIIYLSSLVCSLPFIFQLTKSNAIDRQVGDLSYPLYICHLIVIYMLSGGFGPGGVYPAALSVLMSWAIVRVLDAPMDRFRQRRLARSPRPALGTSV